MNKSEKVAMIKSAFYDDPEMVALLTVRSEEEKKVVEDGLMRIAIYKGEKGETGEQGPQGEQGVPGEDGRDGRPGRDGEDGEPAEPIDPEEIKGIIENLLPKVVKETQIVKEELKVDAQMVKDIIKLMRTLPEKDRLDISQIRNASSFMKDGIKYKIEELMHGSGTGGSGSTLTVETPTGTVNDTNVTFTVAHEPLYIVVNGAQYTVGTGTYASYAGGVITLSSAVGTGGFIKSYYNA